MTDENNVIEVPAAPAGGSKSRVLLGCGIGCGLLVFVVVVLAILLFVVGNRALDRMDVLSKPFLEEQYSVWKDEGIVKAEQVELYDALYDTVYDEEVGSRWVTICVVFLMVYHTEDGGISDSEIEQAQTLLDDIHEQPGLGIQYWSEFMESDDELKRISQMVPLMVRDR